MVVVLVLGHFLCSRVLLCVYIDHVTTDNEMLTHSED